ncbi:transglutaminase-like domain-containing protein [Isoptericola sp. NEAU-Y5]|uniref:Transglutaminase-like domain-containing protein n=1 Tax=Isoptericola luteus TaxID=2879484 RepID=A0ABS7ZKB6_9MICO|nr:transglutaminase-like domain-containing protein [Isoptericola sp. NEAU-Y5]MCA5894289.1 transglutaminase-like domain-containing protein [Isoptericola sp. NEAU-Y5]
MTAPTLDDYARQSHYSDPGAHQDLLRAVAPTPAATGAAACATIVHYRADAPTLTEAQRVDIDQRWLATILDTAVTRRPGPLDAPRDLPEQVAGCCRDHTLFSLGVLRAHGVPARSRIGFAGYFNPPFFNDHVVVEHWDSRAARWVRWDPELTPDGTWDFDVRDMPTGSASPFPTAAEVWRSIRAGEVDPASYGVSPEWPELGGKAFVRSYVMLEVAHRMRDEVLLWDVWGALPDHPGLVALAAGSPPGHVPLVPMSDDAWDALADALAALLVAADAGDSDAEATLAERYAAGLGPRGSVATLSPMGRIGITDLRERSTRWASTPA